MCYVDKGELYTCGDGTFGQLGHGDTESRLLPCRVEHLSSVPINMVACGMRHTLAQGTSTSEYRASPPLDGNAWNAEIDCVL